MKYQLAKALWIASRIKDIGFEIAYIDEFRYSAHDDRFYGWSSKASNSAYWANPQTFNMSFWVMMCQDYIVAIKGTTGTFDGRLFSQFIKESLVFLPENVVLWMDNSSIHKTLEVHKAFEKHNILAWTIPAYSSWLNPWEHLIRSIKMNTRKIQSTGKLVTLRTIKQVVDNINQNKMDNYFAMSIKEIIRFINDKYS